MTACLLETRERGPGYTGRLTPQEELHAKQPVDAGEPG